MKRIASWLVSATLLTAVPVLALDLGDSRIHLVNETYDVSTGPDPAPGLRRAVELAPDEIESWIVALEGPADPLIREALEGAGARIVSHVPSNAYLVRATGAAAARAEALPGVVRVDVCRPHWKISPTIGKVEFRNPVRRAEGSNRRLTVDVFEDPRGVADRLRELGAEILAVHDRAGAARVVVRAPEEIIPEMARLSRVEWIEEVGELALRNDDARWVIQSNVSGMTPLHDQGLFGEGQIVGHIDGPIVTTSCYFQDPDDNTPGPLHRKLVAVYDSLGSTVGQAHGTHTAGTLAGDSFPVNGLTANRGMAPLARLVHTNFGDLRGFNDSPSNFLALLNRAHADGARIHSNSWGESSNQRNGYVTWSVDADTYARNEEEDLVVFAIMNGGQGTTPILAPENAKNVLAVFATGDAPSQDVHATGRMGPTFDGRRRPEVGAPGFNTISASNVGACAVRGDTGTSMACPAVAGGAALVREYFVRGYYPTGRPFAQHSITPTGALLKAMVTNSAVNMTGIALYPNDIEGWGRVLLDRSLYFSGDSRRLWFRDVRHADGLETGQMDEYTIEIANLLEPLDVTLVFADVPASHLTSFAPVNDLDLEVEGPDGLFLGNVFDAFAGSSVTGGSADSLNNTERVIRTVPTPGTWTIRVRAPDVPLGPQGYAVVVNGGLFHLQRQVEADTDGVGLRAIKRARPDEFDLSTPSPNPFAASTEVSLTVPQVSHVTVSVYDIAGRVVRRLLDRRVPPGEYALAWDGRDERGQQVAPGIYFTRMTAPGVDRVVKGVLLR